ncbi:DsbA family oxidoreductase [Luteipulveratus halotolerans]|uniref:Dithiol-disulfide isomerase n=1 Tax=Luteipulveratus halotolerans TaxID=1631356 RepID=A0A0L6CF52_9MICO|nr:DsbA family oxidoreductase [Luteipulveratus halotolerans]KNX36324.1 dithiol-disulfide isomerase [Luteipulveratus halotolerans]
MIIDVWSDIVCPFCHLGRRHLELALEQFEHRDEVEVTWHSFELDPQAPATSDEPVIEAVARKYGAPVDELRAQHRLMAQQAAAVGLDFQWEQLKGGSSHDAHRVIHYARSLDLEQPVTDRIMRGWYSEGRAIGDRETLGDLAAEAGLDRDKTLAMLASDDFGINVRSDEATANQIGIKAVPAFVLDRKYLVSGAQPVETFLAGLQQAYDDRGTAPMPRAGGCGGGCGCGSGGCGSGSGAEGGDLCERPA